MHSSSQSPHSPQNRTATSAFGQSLRDKHCQDRRDAAHQRPAHGHLPRPESARPRSRCGPAPAAPTSDGGRRRSTEPARESALTLERRPGAGTEWRRKPNPAPNSNKPNPAPNSNWSTTSSGFSIAPRARKVSILRGPPARSLSSRRAGAMSLTTLPGEDDVGHARQQAAADAS